MKLGAYVTFQGCTWQVAAVAGASVTLVGETGQTASVLASFLFADPAFTVVGSPATGVQPWGLLESVPERERERALAWQRHIREIETGLPDGPGSTGVPRPEYDPQRQSMAEREQAKADELTRLGWPRVSRATVRRMRARAARELRSYADTNTLTRGSPFPTLRQQRSRSTVRPSTSPATAPEEPTTAACLLPWNGPPSRDPHVRTIGRGSWRHGWGIT